MNDDATTTDQWMATIAVTPDGNKLGIFYYSRQEDPANNNSFRYYGRIGDISGGTVTFNPSFAISDVASLPEFGRDAAVNSVYMGEYNHASVTASPNTFHVVWSDNRDDLSGGAPRKDPNVYYEKISFALPQPPDINVTPTSLTFTVPEGGSDTDILNMANTAPPGYENLNWSIAEQEVTLIASGIDRHHLGQSDAGRADCAAHGRQHRH